MPTHSLHLFVSPPFSSSSHPVQRRAAWYRDATQERRRKEERGFLDLWTRFCRLLEQTELFTRILRHNSAAPPPPPAGLTSKHLSSLNHDHHHQPCFLLAPSPGSTAARGVFQRPTALLMKRQRTDMFSPPPSSSSTTTTSAIRSSSDTIGTMAAREPKGVTAHYFPVSHFASWQRPDR